MDIFMIGHTLRGGRRVSLTTVAVARRREVGFCVMTAAWLRVRDLDPGLQLYSDGLHPSSAGAYVSALVPYACLLAKSPIGLPRRVSTAQGVLEVSDAAAPVLQGAALDVARASCGVA